MGGVEDFPEDFGILAAGPGGGVEGVVGVLGQNELCSFAEAFHNRLQEIELRKLVIRALQEEHRDFDSGQVISAVCAGLAGRVKRESEEDEAFHFGEWISELRLAGHAGAEGAAAGEEREIASEFSGIGDSGSGGGLSYGRIVRAFGAAFHVREIVAQRGDAAFRQSISRGDH
ncbi:MAG: hypothetical protein EON93_12420, partial [Burkholderiales bacterium]